MTRVPLLLSALALAACRGPDLSAYDALVEPRITELPDQRMLVIAVTGNASTETPEAMGRLFRTYFRLKRGHEGLGMVAPRGRWAFSATGDPGAISGSVGMPVPNAIDAAALTDEEKAAGLSVTTWTYGKTAEILHVGSYATEPPTIARLEAFITAQHCTIAGLHEEEYLKGPGMFFAGNPDEYRTLIRYPVTSAPEAEVTP